MIGHGTFIYQPDYAISTYGSARNAAKAVSDLGMSHAWLRAHSKIGLWKEKSNQKLADALRNEGISVGIWGWCDGNNVSLDLDNANTAIAAYEPDIYVADIEHEVNGANWTTSAADYFGKELRRNNNDLKLAVSSFGYIDWHKPEIMTALDQYVDYFAPQVYWFWYPDQRMITQTGLGNIQKKSPADYAKLCLHHWRLAVTKPLVLTGQAYWGEAKHWTRSISERKLKQFLADFDGYDEIVGLNWWSFADPRAMTSGMIAAIRNAHIDQKFAAQHSNGTLSEADTSAQPQSEPTAGLSTLSDSGTHWVAAEELFFRDSPNGDDNENIITALDYDAKIETIGSKLPNGYIKAKAMIDNVWTEGYLFSDYLRPEENGMVERAIQEAVSEWIRFDKGAGVEYREPYSSYINEMWTARGYPNLTGQDREWFWSAAFISFVLENAGYLRTNFDIRHSTYIHESIQNRVLGRQRDFIGYRIEEAEPQVGDILCQWRVEEKTYEDAEVQSKFSSHTDIVIAVRDRSVVTLGGNVVNAHSMGKGVTVETKIWRRATSGLMVDERRLFAIMKNQHRPRDEQNVLV